jgi:hypothetical protein
VRCRMNKPGTRVSAKRASKVVFRLDWIPQRYFPSLKPLVPRFRWWGEPCRSLAAPGALTRGNSRSSGRRTSGSTACVGASKLSESYCYGIVWALPLVAMPSLPLAWHLYGVVARFWCRPCLLLPNYEFAYAKRAVTHSACVPAWSSRSASARSGSALTSRTTSDERSVAW